PDQKRHNKTLERLLREADSASALLALSGQASPGSDWRPLLFQQFHDILPGTSIPEVFDQAETLWRDARRKAKQHRDLSVVRLLQVRNEALSGAALVLVRASTLVSLVALASPPEGLLECGRPAPSSADVVRGRHVGAIAASARHQFCVT
ncbi:alpha-mannosidase, partial [bacterium]|nr:alpha-mannosidase [bacterium]